MALGAFERVGSNWFLDTLRPTVLMHNEPFRQQLHPSHPLSALNVELTRLSDLDHRQLHPYEQHWLMSFVLSKYGRPGHVVKETNLFFAIDGLLGLFPDSPVVVLSRSPIGVASSFARSGLFDRWGYAARYAQLQAMAAHPARARYRFAVPDDGPDKLRMLVRLVTLNAVVLAGALDERHFVHVAYEQALVDQAAALADVAGLLGIRTLAVTHAVDTAATATSTSDDTYNTRRVGGPGLHLDAADIDNVRREVHTLLASAAGALPAPTVERARSWLPTDLDTPGARRPGGGATSIGTARPSRHVLVAASYVAHPATSAVLWRTTLVTNQEYSAFLNDLAAAGTHNVVAGVALFCNESMPTDRGGRLHRDPTTGRYVVEAGYETHPVYWVTWLGAAAFATWAGARLPTRNELDRMARASDVDLDAINAAYRIGDVVPVDDKPGDGPLYHPVGNLQVWCANGPTLQQPTATVTRYLYGAAWNTPATWAEIRRLRGRLRGRHLTGCSRGVGIRLTRGHLAMRPEPAAAIAARLHIAFGRLGDRAQDLGVLDSGLVRAVDPHGTGRG